MVRAEAPAGSEYSASMEFRVLGPLEVVSELGPVSLGGPQQRRVLAALLSDPGHVLTYERLGEVLWPDGDGPANPRRSAITYVSRLRTAVGDGVVLTTDAGYVLDTASLNIDAARFVALVDHAATLPAERALDVLDQALAMWRGPVFGDLSGEWWARPFVKKLEELRLTALANRIDAMTAGGWNGRSIAEVTSLLDAHPLREQFVEKAMRGLHAIGQTADALRAFHRYRSELAEQTGLDPSAALCELESSMATGAALDPSPTDIARPLRGYVLRELIGEGSFGAVYRATQPGVERDVAVKVIRPELADDRSFVMRFEVEARLVARLEHPNIVPLYDFWRQPGGAFLVFRLMRGGSADELITHTGPLTLDRAGAVLEQIGGALASAHAAGIVHRDVKPANILFDDAGIAYLADFGIAAAIGDESPAPQRWSAGSALYASPEQLRDGVEDARADQYALAVTVWEMLAGRAAFEGRDASAVIRSKLRGPLGSIDAVRADVPAAIGAVLERAGAVHPLDRYSSVTEFVSAWQRAASGAITTTTPPDASSSPTADSVTRSVAATVLNPGIPVSNPYKGLRPFGEVDVQEFRGRDALVERLVVATDGVPFVTVVGPSGSGKSSLVLAGLIPRLRARRCLVVVMTPGENPFASLSSALAQIAIEEQSELLSTNALRRHDGVRLAVRTIAADDELVVVIDQLEELWTLTGEDERQRFITAIVDPVEAGLVKVVATVRADFFDRPLADPALGPLVSASPFGVTPMSTSELHDAISSPADQVGVRFEAALVSRLVAETVDQPGSLPMLQFALAELFERRDGAMVTADAYDALGGLAGALSRQADEIYLGFDASDRAAVRRMFSRLVTPGEGNEDTRRRAIVSDLAGVPTRVVTAYVDRRLLTSDRDRDTREPTVEVAHEVLLRAWPKLQGWLADDRSWLRELRALSTAAASWVGGGCDPADLYRGARLGVIAELVAAHPGALTATEQRFLDQSVDQSASVERESKRRLEIEVRQNRRLRRSLVGIAAVLVVALGAGMVAIVQRQRADRQQRVAVAQRQVAVDQQGIADQQRAVAIDAQKKAQQSATAAQDAQRASELRSLAGQSLAVRSSQRDLAALLAIEAWKGAPDAVSKSALFGTFTYDPGFMGYLRFDGAAGVQGIAIPGTSTMLVSTVPRNTGLVSPVSIVDVNSGNHIRQLAALSEQRVTDVSFVVSPHGRFAAEWVGGPTDGTSAPLSTAAVVDLSTGDVVGQPLTLPHYRNSLAVDDTGTRLAAGSDEMGGVTVYDSTNATVVTTISGLPGAASASDADSSAGALAYGPDGRLFVGSTGGHLRAFDPVTFALTTDIQVPDFSTLGTMRFTDDGSTAVVRSVHIDKDNGSQIGSIIRIDLAQGIVRWQVSGADYGFGECASFAFSATTDQLWRGNYFGRIRERSFRTGARTGRVLQNQKGWATDLDLVSGPTGVTLVATSNNDGVISRWRVDGGGPIQRLIARGKLIVGLFRDGTTLLVAADKGTQPPFNLDYSLWDLTSDTPIAGLPPMLLANVAGNSVTGVFADDVKIGKWDRSTNVRSEMSIALTPQPISFAASDDGTTLLLGYLDGHVDEYDIPTDVLVQRMQLAPTADGDQPAAVSVAIGADRSHVYVAGDGIVSFDGTTGKPIAHNRDRTLGNVQVTASGVVVGASVDGTLAIYDPTTLVKSASLPGARGFIQNMIFSADGTTLLAAGNDGSVSVDDFTTRTRIGDAIDLDRGDGTPSALRPDGGAFAIETPRNDGIEVWDLEPAHWLAAACAIAGRNLTLEEWSTYIGDLATYAATCPEFPLPTDR